MSLEKIFMVLAIILGLGSIIDLLYLLITTNVQLAQYDVKELLRCSLNTFIAAFLYLYARKRYLAKLENN